MLSPLISSSNVPPEVLRELMEAWSKPIQEESIVEPIEIFEGQLSLFDLCASNNY